jgi:hypothetical protein
VLPYCAEHCCGQREGFHNRDAPEGRYYPACHCIDSDEGKRKWMRPEPCTFCGRIVANDDETANPWRFTKDWSYFGCHTPHVRVFCSEQCRRSVRRVEAKAQRIAARANAVRSCETCHREFSGRADARYCCAACRQAAYRRRHSGDHLQSDNGEA